MASEKVQTLLSQMTLEEKVGQMTQVTLETLCKGRGVFDLDQPITLDSAKLNKIIGDYAIGSVLNCAGEARSRESWQTIIGTIQDHAINKTRLGIPVLYGIDAIHGTNYTLGATLFPQQVGLAATWNPGLVEDLAAICAYETRASNIPWNFSPDLDLGMDARWPRIWEGFGEDPYLSGEMGKAMVRGFGGNDVSAIDKVASCLKHFIGYGYPRSGKDRTPAWLPERHFRELFVPPFSEGIASGAKTVMINSGEVNGIPVHASVELLTKLLREDMGFTGVAVTDWYDIYNLVERHRVAKDKKEATKIAINAGIDMAMVPYDVEFADHLIALVKEGEVSMERINEAVGRILQLKEDVGLFERPTVNTTDYDKFGSEEFAKKAYQGAIESITLLKNEDGILPLSKNSSVLVAGPNADNMRVLNGGWSYTWQGERTDEFVKDKNTILKAVTNKVGKDQVTYIPGVKYGSGNYKQEKIEGLDRISKVAKSADAVILCIGENTYTEKPGDLDDLNLSINQKNLAREAAKSGTPIIYVLSAGRPRVFHDIEPLADAIVHIYLPGNEGGDALVDVLFGDANPSGKLPFTYPRYVNDLVPYYYKHAEVVAHADGNEYTDPFVNPQYPFGFGLSYTTFEYGDMTVDKKVVGAGDTCTLKI
ncbi:MAG: glycoside hydrolase family 3 C-terminal domain-containing protein, partial [Cyclobacteriaceae bacterium]|nr:glycoside hydrolase family 3 C-terminal domain-containing protein [Cyclobacteriaceae bacterium HetDA_MAG_MS6]